MPYIAKLRPNKLPTTVVYPFGGGDLLSALATYPAATEITTISLEAAGDVSSISRLDKNALRRELKLNINKVKRLFGAAHSTTKSLQTASHSRLPGSIIFALVAFSIHGFEPVSARYFEIERDGSLRYLTKKQLDELLATQTERVKQAFAKHRNRRNKMQVWKAQEATYKNIEIQYRQIGASNDEPLRVYRHIVANLDDEHLTADPGLLEHLKAKGKVAAMTKAASYLLWFDEFSMIRNYLLENMVWMISDTSGIAPADAQAAGFEQIPYGVYVGPYSARAEAKHSIRRAFIALWKKSADPKLPFRYGYPDAEDHNHLMVTRRRAK